MTESSTDTSSAGINAATLRLPEFSTTAPRAWFVHAEAAFRSKGIAKPSTKADLVICALPSDVFGKVAPWLEEVTLESDDLNYDAVKSYLIKKFSPDVPDRAKRILELPRFGLGDLTAREKWEELQALMRLPAYDPTTQKPKRVDLEREIWLQCLPEQIRKAIPHAEELEMDALIKQAEGLMAASRASGSQHLSGSNAVSAQDAKSEPSVDVNKASRPRPPARPLYVLLPSGLCGYHTKFGSKAKMCVPGCSWPPKNAPAGRAV